MSNELPTKEEINAASDWCRDTEETGESNYPGMTYEQGVLAALDWMQGYGENPTS